MPGEQREHLNADNDSRSSFLSLCHACRIGDVDNADQLISSGVLNINDVDNFDNSPLFLASLCGHIEMVRLLLNSGAICDRDRHEGARCIYGALNDEIRNLLIDHDISRAFDVKLPFATDLAALLPSNLDKCHDFLLSARCPKLLEEMDYVKKHYSSEIINVIVKYLYLVPVLHEVSKKHREDVKSLALLLNLNDLALALDRISHLSSPADISTTIVEFQVKFNEKAKDDLKLFVDKYVIGSKIFLESGLSDTQILDPIKCLLASPVFADILIKVTDPILNQTFIYSCHSQFLLRCDYFKQMFSLPMSENLTLSKSKYILTALPNVSHEVVELLIRYVYHDNTTIPTDHSISLLLLSDYLLTQRLKSVSAVAITTQAKSLLSKHSIFELLSLGWRADVERLEQFAAKHLVENLDTYIDSIELRNAIEQSAKRISVREEKDTIELIDDMKYYLLEKYKLEQDDYAWSESNGLLDENVDIEEEDEFIRSIRSYKFDIDRINTVLTQLNLYSKR